MAKMWAGRTDGATEQIADDFNSSIRFDSRMYKQDIKGSVAHAAMLAEQGIISADDAKKIQSIFDNGIRFWKATAEFGNYNPYVNPNEVTIGE